MANLFNEYGFKRKRFMSAHYGSETGTTRETNRGCTFGYTKSIGNPQKDDVVYELNIIPQNNEWVCEIVKVDYKLWREHINDSYEEQKKLKWITSKKWAWMQSKEDALNEIVEQYGYMF